jgi:formate-dependent nitrite reductase membrane component NrfD
MIETEIVRNSNMVDPQLHIWGWEIPLYLFLGGVTAGLMILSALAASRFEGERSRALRWSPFFAIVLLSAGMGALFLDLESKLHVFRFYLSFRLTSPMSWGSWILLAIYPAALLFGIAQLTPMEWTLAMGRIPAGRRILTRAREFALRRARGLAIWNGVLGIALGTYTGILLGTLGARSLWSSPILGPLFLASGFSSAAAVLMLARLARDERHWITRWDAGALVIELALIALYFGGLLTGSGATRAAARLLIEGPYAATFWAFVVLAGLALPLAMEGLERKLRLAPSVAIPVLILIGGVSLRWILVAAGQAA